MPTYRGRRALVACLVLLAAGWLTAADAVAQTDPGTETTVTTAAAADPPLEYAPPRDSEPATTTTSVVAAPVETTSTTTSSAPAVTPSTSPAAVTPGQGARVTTTTTATADPAAGASRTAAAPATGGATTAPALADTATAGAPNPKASVSLDIPGTGGKPSQSLLIIVLITLLSVAPALLIMVTSFTRIVIVLSLTRNALGLHTIPPNQVIVGLAMFLSFFVMSPTFGDINRDAIQPLLKGEKTQSQAYDSAVTPLRTFMLKQTRKGELAMFSSAANGGKRPEKPEDVGLAALIPAFILSELKTAFIIGFVIFIPFLVIDIVVSSSLMSMGMMMLPPVFVSLPFKLLLFVMVDGWGLVVRSLLKSFA
jgi:flagellar biosynthetic protein FliP